MIAIAILACAIFSLFVRVSAEGCCGFDGVNSCCGSGGCDIYCCGCKTACTQSCPERCLALCQQECPPIPSDPNLWQWYDQQCYVHCANVCYPPGDTVDDELAKRSLVRSVFDHVERRKRDEELFREIDREGIGFFDFGQFLDYRGWENTAALRSHFDRYDRDGDGVITFDEMRRET